MNKKHARILADYFQNGMTVFCMKEGFSRKARSLAPMQFNCLASRRVRSAHGGLLLVLFPRFPVEKGAINYLQDDQESFLSLLLAEKAL